MTGSPDLASRRWRRRAEVAFVGDEERIAGVNLADPAGAAFILEGTAALIWSALADQDEAELCRYLTARFAAGTDGVAEQVHEFLTDLEQQGLVEGS